MALATIDETGLHLPDYPTVLEDVKARFRGIYGDDLYLGPDSQDGQLCAVFALALHDAYTLAGSVYNAYSPATAQGTGLSRMVKINGLRRKPSGRSTVDLRLVGQAGTVIRGGMAGDAAGKRWLLPDEVAIPQSGEITVTATAEESGDIRPPPGTSSRSSRPPGAGSPWATPPRPCRCRRGDGRGAQAAPGHLHRAPVPDRVRGHAGGRGVHPRRHPQPGL